MPTKRDGPVLTRALEEFVADYKGKTACVIIPVGESTGKKMAVVGAGPVGLSCAVQLTRFSH